MKDIEYIFYSSLILGLFIALSVVIWAISINVNEDIKVHKVNDNCIAYKEKMYCLKGDSNE